MSTEPEAALHRRIVDLENVVGILIREMTHRCVTAEGGMDENFLVINPTEADSLKRFCRRMIDRAKEAASSTKTDSSVPS